MCGITGIFCFSERAAQQSLHQTATALHTLRRRGPDSAGSYQTEHLAIAQARLAIIDTSDAANQPFADPTGRYQMVFNGEIFNFQELKQQLPPYQYRTHSDTEVLLYAYIHWGEKMLERLNGFFTIAIYDTLQHELFLARDRYGVKPLLLYQDEERLIFASEMKALLAFQIPKKLNFESLALYFQLHYIPAPHSIFENVVKMMPATYCRVTAKGVQPPQTYYQIPAALSPTTPAPLSYTEAQQSLYELLDQAVARRLVADVPLGCFLSGGIDSSIITALAAQRHPQINTFSIGFKDQAFYDETRFALQVANRYQTNHHAFVLTTQELYEQLYPAIDYLDEPFADSSALAVYILSQQTAQKVKVALSGDGADELLAGYNKHIAAYRFQHPKMLERVVGLLQPIWQKLPQNRHSFWGNKVRQLDKFAQMSQFSPAERYWRMAVWNQPEQVQKLMQLPHNFWQKRAADYTNNMNGKTLNETLLTDFHLVLQGDMLQKVDSMSMANSLEVRTPFLDYTVVDFVFSLPDYYKISTQRSKRLLVDSFKHLLPTDVYNRPKHGFEVPLAQWFRGELHQTIHQNLLQKDFIKQQGLFNPIFVEHLLQKLQTNNMGDTPVHIWALIVFQNWWKRYFSDSCSIS